MAQDDVFDFIFQIVAEFIALAVEKLDAVVFHWVMRSGNHNACIQTIFPYQISHCGCRHNACQHCVSAYGADACYQCRFQHITADAGIHTHQNAGCVFCFFCQYICACTSQLESHFPCQFCIRYTADTVRTK